MSNQLSRWLFQFCTMKTVMGFFFVVVAYYCLYSSCAGGPGLELQGKRRSSTQWWLQSQCSRPSVACVCPQEQMSGHQPRTPLTGNKHDKPAWSREAAL